MGLLLNLLNFLGILGILWGHSVTVAQFLGVWEAIKKKSRFQILYAYIYIPKINTWQKLCLFSKIKSYTVLVFWGEVNFTKSYLSLLYF